VVDGAQLLAALLGHIHLIAGVARIQTCADLGVLALTEMFNTAAQQPGIW
jgi:hypothetical protein